MGAFFRTRGLQFDKCCDSGYLRATATRRIALQAAYPAQATATLGVRSELLLRERETGILRNMPTDDIERNPLLALWFTEFKRNPFQTKYLGGESLADVVDRVRFFRDWVSERHGGSRIVVFCHDVVIKAFRIVLIHLDVSAAIQLALSPPTPNGGVHLYTRGPSGWSFEQHVPSLAAEPPESRG